MVQFGNRFSFIQKLVGTAAHLNAFLGRDFNGNGAIQIWVAGEIDTPKSAFSQNIEGDPKGIRGRVTTSEKGSTKRKI